MGAWGYGPFENDSAMDFVSELISSKALSNLVNTKPKYRDYNDFRAAAEIVVVLHTINDHWFDQETIDKLAEVLKEAIADKEWHGSWRDERYAKDIVKRMRVLVKKLDKLEGY